MAIDLSSTPITGKPNGFTEGLTGQGEAVSWQVLEDPSAPGGRVIAETSRDTADYRFPLCIYDGLVATDAEVSTWFKAVDGQVDQAAGLIVRAQDHLNYYVARANALENNVSLYYTLHGRRNTLKYVDAPVASKQWHTLRVEFAGRHIEVSLDGKRYIQFDDDHIADKGAVGVWTKADSVTLFDDFTYGSSAPR